MLSALLVATAMLPNLLDGEAFPGDGAVSKGSEGVHDPTLIEFGGKYFIFHTGGNSFGVVRSSKDLRSWTTHGGILPKQPEWLEKRYRHKSIWAPDVVVLGDKIRVYYCASNWGTNESVIGLAECDRFNPEKPTEGWVDRGLLLESKPNVQDFNAIDPEVLVDREGRHWMFFGSYWSGIHVVELDPFNGMLKKPTEPEIIGVARNTGERGNPLEGAAVVEHGGYYHLFVSYGLAAQGVRSTYRIMAGRSKSPTGPFLDKEGKSMADGGHVSVLKTSPPMFAPGHSDALRLKDGRYVMPYHFYDGRKHWHGDVWGRPMLQIREILWDRDGWPVPGLPLEMNPPKTGPVAASTPKGRWLHQADFGEPREIEFKADGSFASGETKGFWKQTGNRIDLSWPREGNPSEPYVDQVELAYGGTYYVGRTQTGMVVRGIRTGAK